MVPVDFKQARAVHSALNEFFASHPKGKLDPAAVTDVQALCRAAERAVPDADCRRAIRNIESYTQLLSSREPTARGPDFVRLRVHNALASFRSKLDWIEAAQPG